MAKRIPVALSAVLISMFVALPALAQMAAAHAPVDLSARLMQLQISPRQLDAMYKAGSKVAAVCANCHGEGGNSTKPDIPNLAGQNPSYLLEQMRQFSAGERKNEFMEGMIKALSPNDKLGMVVFYSKQEVSHKPPANAALVSQGQAYFSKTCFQCHGSEGRGNEKVARIAGQQLNYLNLTLKRYRDGSHVRNNPLMAATTRPMTDADITAVAAYVSSMK